MLTQEQLKALLSRSIAEKAEQGFDIEGLPELPDSLDDLAAFAEKVSGLPLRADWPYVEPDSLDAVREEGDPNRETGSIGSLPAEETAERIRAAFYARVCGCMLGKPFEIDVTLQEIRSALQGAGEWPLAGYAPEAVIDALPRRQGQWAELVSERLAHVVPDDDLNYTILAMLALESKGADFTHGDMRRLWLYNLPIAATFGPERTQLVRSGAATLAENGDHGPRLNPGEELCGALIRADAYGYACIGNPELAAHLAHRDATFTHAKTGAYGPMFVAAAIAVAPFTDDRVDIFRKALQFVPQRSRFAECVRASIALVADATDWLDGYERIHATFGGFGFCRILQEIGTVINSVRFATDVGDGICKQVMQGNDTDSFGATAGSILGSHFGPGHLDDRWIAPLRDDLHTALASFHERSLAAVADRMAALPSRIS